MKQPKSYESQLETAKDIVINSIAETMDLYGINRSVGNLYGIMLFKDSMTLDEMRQELQMSKPSMSAGVKKLQELDVVKQRFTRGSRKQHFEAEKDFFDFFSNFFTKKWQREYTVNFAAVKEAEAIINSILAADDVDEATREEAEEIKAHLAHSRVYYHWLENISQAIQTGEIFEHYPIPDLEETEK
ncbi:GbsR/MarR family transcriptional regulator [Staphylococcus chromogenes]|uniref:choline uptake/conversion transcriptional regulator CudC n=1 Tax=Staphylococcus chromogenes TaxID=46126 RepID=UPI00118B7E49|nr:GbsR/MarR family transcriptional regulator [Staphylococcus chromogenes]QDW90725.1 GbsR/MarR family transcriptional regulator [Staphylococcus chromogenes]QIN25755.1 GbsR/MarR family transcriptional regulator [Staphylococcus chromogenes]